ncbi:MAG: GNAT family N-acetyltransferase [Thermoleophilaceae bacterium]|nr:GNAT family N-acetyltransferase [Thermoleophilaceae bacterium]
MSLRIRPAREADAGLLLSLIRELAEYERLAHEVVGSEELLRRHLFGERPAAEAVIAEVDGEPAGFALFYTSFSTFLCRPGLWLEDLFVRPQHRGAGVGRALLAHLARVALERGYGRMEWWVLDWNEPAIGFYRSIGAEPMSDWTVQRLQEAALRALAES